MANCDSVVLGRQLLTLSQELQKNQRAQESCVEGLLEWWKTHNPVNENDKDIKIDEERKHLLVSLPQLMNTRSVSVKS